MAKKPVITTTPKAELPVKTIENPIFKKLFIGFMVLLMLVIPFFSKDAGINGDERFQVYLATYVIPFYTSFGKDRRMYLTRDEVMPTLKKGGMDSVKKEFNIDVFPQASDLKNYGCGFEFWSALIARIFGYAHDDQLGFHIVRHVLLGIITVLIMLFAGLIAKELLDWRAALITVFLLAISPGFIGQGMMNNKDVPFAFGYIVAVYFMIRFLKQLPFPDWKSTLGVMFGLAAAINIRVGGLMLIFYFVLFCLAFWFYYQRIKKDSAFNNFNLRASATKAFLASSLGYFLGLVFWPYGLLSPISNPLEVLKTQASFPTVINQIFEGKIISSSELPWYYETKLLLMATPVVILLGVLVAAVMLFRFRKQLHPGLVGVLIFVIFFPIFYIAYSHANVYNGWRHVLFVYPLIAVLAGLGYALLIETFKANAFKIGTVAAVLALSIMPATFIVAEHPHEYVYYNELAGGMEGAYGNYTLDYYMLSVREATDWLVKNEINKSSAKVMVATDCAYPLSVFLHNSVPDKTGSLYIRYYDRNSKDWDYGIFYSEFVSPAQLKKHNWPPDGTIYEVKAGGVPICAVVKRLTKLDLEGHNAIEAKDYPKAIDYLQKASVICPKNEGIWTDLGLAYLSTGNMDKGIEALTEASKIYPDNPMVYYYLGIAYAQASPPNLNYTERYMKKALELNPGFSQAQEVLNQVHQSQGGGGFK